MTALTLTEAIANLEKCSDEQLAELADYATAQIATYAAGLAAAQANRPSYAPQGRETRTERGQFALREDARRLLVKVQREIAKRASTGARTIISILRSDGSIKTIVRPTIFRETARVSFIADAATKGVEVIGWHVEVE
jgi:pyruvate dehydrogenase complex dehydrogenase (E1) component